MALEQLPRKQNLTLVMKCEVIGALGDDLPCSSHDIYCTVVIMIAFVLVCHLLWYFIFTL